MTERLVLRPWSVDDAEAALVIYGDPEVTRYIGGRTAADLDAMRAQLEAWLARVAQYPAGQGVWAAVLDGTVVGCGLLKPLPDVEGSPTDDIEVGWHLGRPWWGQGLATEMGHTLLHHAVQTLGLADVHAVVEPPNHASMRVAERIGLHHVGRTTAYYGGREFEYYRLHPEH